MDGFYAEAARLGDAIAIKEPGREPVTFEMLLERVNALSLYLEAMDLPRGSVITGLLPGGVDHLTLDLAVAQLPFYFTPINWHLAAPEVAYILADSAAAVFVTDESVSSLASAAVEEAGLPASSVVVSGQGWGGTQSLESILVDHHPGASPRRREAGQRMLYTSGTTGRPKGVRRPLPGVAPEQALKLVEERARAYGMLHPNGVHMSTAPLYHAAPGAYAVQALHMGHMVTLLGRWDAAGALEKVESDRVTHTYMVPTMFADLLGLPDERKASHDLTSLRSVVHTAAPCPAHVKQRMIDWLGPILYEIYGGTEGSATLVTSEEWLRRPGTVGRPRPGIDLRILDAGGKPVPSGEVGQVYIRNPVQGFEYLGDPEKTSSTRHGEHFTLGDIGYLDEEGYLFLCDRSADVILIGGSNVYPAEVEAVLAEHPDVRDVAVIGIPDERMGEAVCAVVQPRHPDATAEDLQMLLLEYCRGRLASYKRPKVIELRAQLPRSETGKLLRRQVRQEFWGHRSLTS